jgi:hypothetical protein
MILSCYLECAEFIQTEVLRFERSGLEGWPDNFVKLAIR